MRKFFLLVLLLTAWALIFLPLYSDDLARLDLFFSTAHPSDSPYPPAWRSTERLQVRSQDASPSAGSPASSPPGALYCGDSYTIQNGDTLGEIARRCGMSLSDLLSANPNIPNPNRVYTGQRISLPDPQAGRGGADPALADVSVTPAARNAPSAAQPGAFRPGSVVTIEAAGLPPNAPVRIGLGLSSVGYTVVAQAQTDASGRISAAVTLPGAARPGDSAFIMVSTTGVPSVQRMSQAFSITE